MKHLDTVLQRLIDNKWYCKRKKCEFATTTVEYLGHFISNGKLSIDPDKMKAVHEWLTPFKNVTEVQSFLGLVGYYRRFVKNFSRIAQPLHALTHKDTPFEWKHKHTEAVNKLKSAISDPDCLAIFNPNFKTILRTDACEHALGAVLSQVHPEGERPVSFISKSLISSELNYTIWEKELYAVVWSIRYFRPYLLSNHFQIYCDNKPAVQIVNSQSLKLTTMTNNRILRWLADIQSYNYELAHLPGKTNIVADALSRFTRQTTLTPNEVESAQLVQTIFPTPTDTPFVKLLKATYEKLDSVCKLFELLKRGEYHPRYILSDGLIITRETPYRIFVPDDVELRKTLLNEIHDSPLAGHPGIQRLLSYVNRVFVGPRIRPDVIDYVNSCPQCQLAKPRNDKPYGVITPLQPPEEPWQDISMDFIGKLPSSNSYDAILVIVARFSKMAHFIPTNVTCTASKTASLFFDNIVRLHGFPRSIISDRDSRFLSNFWTELFSLCETTLRFSTPNHPQTDGQTERTNRTLEQYLRIYAKNVHLVGQTTFH